MKIIGQALQRVFSNGKTVETLTRGGKTFTSVFDEAGNLLSSRVKQFTHSAYGDRITRYTTKINYSPYTVTNETAQRMYGCVPRAPKVHMGTEITRVKQQCGGGNLLSSEQFFITPEGKTERICSQWTPYDFSDVHKFIG